MRVARVCRRSWLESWEEERWRRVNYILGYCGRDEYWWLRELTWVRRGEIGDGRDIGVQSSPFLNPCTYVRDCQILHGSHGGICVAVDSAEVTGVESFADVDRLSCCAFLRMEV